MRCFPLAPSFDHAGPMGPRRRPTCARMLEALAPGFERAGLDSLNELEVGVAWLEHAEPLERARVEAAAGALPAPSCHSRSRSPRGSGRPSCARRPSRTAGSSPSTRPPTAKNVRAKLERCLEVTDAESRGGAAPPGGVSRAGGGGGRGVRPAPSTPTLAFVAPPAIRDDLEIRDAMTRFDEPLQRARLAGARAAPWPGRGRASRLGAARGARRRGRPPHRRRPPCSSSGLAARPRGSGEA